MPSPAAEFGAGGDAHPQDGGDDMLLSFPDPGVVELPGEPDAHRVVGGTELDHVNSIHREQRLQVLHRAVLLDHEGHDRLV